MVEIIETQELIQKLVDHGYEAIVEAFLLNERSVMTRGNRINKSGTCRQLNCKTKQLEDALRAMKEILKGDYLNE